MRIAVCEDNSADLAFIRAGIEAYCRRSAYRCEIETFTTGEALLQAFEPGRFHALFLDIYLPGITGMETARRIRAADEGCAIIFSTVSLDHALEGFGVAAAGYVVKPLERQKLDKALDTCRALFVRHSRLLEIPVEGEALSLPVAQIRYAEVFGKYTRFHTLRGEVEARISLERVEEALGGIPFLRCHRSYLVNMNYVAHMDEREFQMRGGGAVPIRKNGSREVRLQMARFLSGYREEALV